MSIFVLERRVRYVDTDQFGAAHHSRMLCWFEEARTDLLRELGKPYGEFEAVGMFFPVSEVGCRYRRPARFDAVLRVAIERIEVRGASLRFEYRVTEGDSEVAEGFTEHACVDRGGKVRRMPAEVRAFFGAKGTRDLAGTR